MNCKAYDRYYGLPKELYNKIADDYKNTTLTRVKIAEIHNIDYAIVQRICHKFTRKLSMFNNIKEFKFTDKGDGMYCDFDLNPILGYNG